MIRKGDIVTINGMPEAGRFQILTVYQGQGVHFGSECCMMTPLLKNGKPSQNSKKWTPYYTSQLTPDE